MRDYIQRHKKNVPTSPAVLPATAHVTVYVNGSTFPACPLFPFQALVEHLENCQKRNRITGRMFSALRKNVFTCKLSNR